MKRVYDRHINKRTLIKKSTLCKRLHFEGRNYEE